MKYIIIMSALISFSLAVDYFPINAWHVKDTLWFKSAGKDSLGLNMINYEEQIGLNDKLKILNRAYQESLDVMLRHATRNIYGTWGKDDIEWYCRLYSGQWEAESTCFYHGYGELVADDSAHNGYAWKASVGVTEAMIMMKGPADRARQSHALYAQFYLKVDTLLQPDTITICSFDLTP